MLPRPWRKWAIMGSIIGSAVGSIIVAYLNTRKDVARVEQKQDFTSVVYLDKVEGLGGDVNRVYEAVLQGQRDTATKFRDLNRTVDQLKAQLRELQQDQLDGHQRLGDGIFEIDKKVSKRR